MMDLSAFCPRRILACQLRQIGDVVLATPALELLKRRFPGAELHVVAEKKCAPVLYGSPYIDRLWELDKSAFVPFWKEFLWYWKVARQSFDLVVDFQQLPRCRWIVGFSGAPVRLSFPAPWYNRLLYNVAAPPQAGYSAASKVSLLKPLGIEWHGEPPRIFLSNGERAQAEAVLEGLGLPEGARLVTLAPTHKDATRRWPAAHFAELARLLLEAAPDLWFLPLHGPGEEGTVRDLLASMAPEVRAVTLLPELPPSLRRSAAWIARASLHVGNCSAPRHIAVAVGTPSCTVLGASNDSWSFPSPRHAAVRLGLPCQPCRGGRCQHGLRCLSGLAPETVFEKALPLLK
ncbi:MAG: glycosyltransferase family 9 protein [Desulfovibrionaceae bacterium]|nr:glycosyltransferase family 9 protein [Desulfovibrionaceae bacterium]